MEYIRWLRRFIGGNEKEFRGILDENRRFRKWAFDQELKIEELADQVELKRDSLTCERQQALEEKWMLHNEILLVVAALSKLLPAHLEENYSDELHVVIETPAGIAMWNIDAGPDPFSHLEHGESEWDEFAERDRCKRLGELPIKVNTN